MSLLLFAQDPAPQQAPGGLLGSPMFPFFLIGLMLLFWVVVVLPMSRRQKKEQEQMLAKQAQALTLFVVAQHSPQTWHVFKEMTARLQAQVAAQLPPEMTTTARARGEQLTLAEIIAEVLQEAGD